MANNPELKKSLKKTPKNLHQLCGSPIQSFGSLKRRFNENIPKSPGPNSYNYKGFADKLLERHEC